MGEVREKNGYEMALFKPETSSGEKTRGIVFFLILTGVVLAQAFFWVFANKVQPIVLGMPFGMFVVVLLIVVEFAILATLYHFENSGSAQKGGAR